MSFIRKSVPPPDVKEGEVLTAKVVLVEFPVESSYKDDKGQPRQQIKFRLRFANGYECNSWMAYYEHPSDRSALASLSITYMNTIKGPIDSVKDVLEGILKRGSVYAKCSGFREYNEQLYPKFKVVTDKLPAVQETIPQVSQQPQQLSEVDLDRLSAETKAKVLAELNK